jgi:2-(1,2-epoxy-1,2-dihydrophenyl)acetyl-CoA isomerase
VVTTVRVDSGGDGVTSIVLARPERGNALDLATAEALRDAVTEVLTAEATRTVVLRGDGDRFCVGGDLRAFADAPDGARLNEVVARPLHEAILALRGAAVPVLCAVNGPVGGGGVGLVLAADLAVAARSCVFRLGYTGSGLTPDCGVTWDLPRRVGTAVATDLILTNRRVTADEAAALGLVARVVDDEALDAEVARLAGGLARIPRETLRQTKRLLAASPGRTLADQLDDEATTIGTIGDTADARETVAAFLAKRPPRLSG